MSPRLGDFYRSIRVFSVRSILIHLHGVICISYRVTILSPFCVSVVTVDMYKRVDMYMYYMSKLSFTHVTYTSSMQFDKLRTTEVRFKLLYIYVFRNLLENFNRKFGKY